MRLFGRRKKEYEERPDSQVPPGLITKGPVLCVDIDGVLSPVGHDLRYHIEYPPLGFVDVGRNSQIHPALPGWVRALEGALRAMRLDFELGGHKFLIREVGGPRRRRGLALPLHQVQRGDAATTRPRLEVREARLRCRLDFPASPSRHGG